MNRQEIDARVQAAIENLQSGRGVEDDAGIEFKGDWPDPLKKARQLAGAANALRGDPLLLVIGVDDKSGVITTPERREPHEWYAQVAKKFDQVAPELLGLQTVFVGRGEQSVQVLVVGTSDFPYVINDGNRREVPLRIGSGTESARRNQLVRMFEPSLRMPSMSITECEVRADWSEQVRQGSDSTPSTTREQLRLTVSLRARVLIEHFGSQPTTLPVRDMMARICGDGLEVRPEVYVTHLGDHFPVFFAMGEAPPPEPVPPQYGVYARDQHVIATAPGEFTISTSHIYQDVDDQATAEVYLRVLSEIDEMRVDLALRVVGVDNVARLTCQLRRTEGLENKEPRQGTNLTFLEGRLGAWELVADKMDPWT